MSCSPLGHRRWPRVRDRARAWLRPACSQRRADPDGKPVPCLWTLGSRAVAGERRGRIGRAESAAFVAVIEEPRIVADPAAAMRGGVALLGNQQ